MAHSQLYRLVATAYLLFLSSLVEGLHHDIITITSDVIVTVTHAPAIPVPANITGSFPSATTTPGSTPATDSFLPAQTISPPAPPVDGSQQEVLFTVAIQQAVLANFANAFVSNAPQAVITLSPPPNAATDSTPVAGLSNAPHQTSTASAVAAMLGAQVGAEQPERRLAAYHRLPAHVHRRSGHAHFNIPGERQARPQIPALGSHVRLLHGADHDMALLDHMGFHTGSRLHTRSPDLL